MEREIRELDGVGAYYERAAGVIHLYGAAKRHMASTCNRRGAMPRAAFNDKICRFERSVRPYMFAG